MGKSSNQEIEKYYFGMFRKDYPLPFGTVIYGVSPDVVIDCERKIGIEITNFFHKPGSLPESETDPKWLARESRFRGTAFI